MAALSSQEELGLKLDNVSKSRYSSIADDVSNEHDAVSQTMELEHMIGISTYFRQCFQPHPKDSNLYLHALGNIVVISDFTDPLSF